MAESVCIYPAHYDEASLGNISLAFVKRQEVSLVGLKGLLNLELMHSQVRQVEATLLFRLKMYFWVQTTPALVATSPPGLYAVTPRLR